VTWPRFLETTKLQQMDEVQMKDESVDVSDRKTGRPSDMKHFRNQIYATVM